MFKKGKLEPRDNEVDENHTQYNMKIISDKSKLKVDDQL